MRNSGNPKKNELKIETRLQNVSNKNSKQYYSKRLHLTPIPKFHRDFVTLQKTKYLTPSNPQKLTGKLFILKNASIF